jgi:uncharacterized membrane protein
MKHLRRYLLAGLAVVLPTAITAYVLLLLFRLLDNILGDYLRHYTGLDVPGIGVAAIVAIILLAGMVASNLIGRRLVAGFHRTIESVPFLNRIYRAVRQISDTLLSENSTVFRRVGLVEFPRRGAYSICFVTSEDSGEIEIKLGRRMMNVFVPTSPNPMSGFMLTVPVDEVMPLSMSVEDGMKVVVSAGSFVPLGGAAVGARPLGSQDKRMVR